MSDVLLTHSYFLRFDPKEFKAMMPYPPLGTLYVASYLRSLGFSVALHDTMFSSREDEIADALATHKPRIVVIYDDGFNYLTKMCLTRMREAAFRMSRISREAGCTVVVAGSDATDHADAYLEHGADYILSGEGEITLGELVLFLTGRTSATTIDSIRGLVFRSNGTLHSTQKRVPLSNLDVLPFPAWDLIESAEYKRRWLKRHGYFSLNLVTTRGCPYHCNWCAKPIYGQVYHSRTPENVVQEMLHVRSTLAPDHIWFADDIFGLTKGWIEGFDRLVHRENALIPFKCLSRVDLLLHKDAIRLLRHAGCRSVWVGAESGSQKILDAMEKGTTVEQIHEASRRLHEAGIRVGFFLQFGYPGEDRADIEKTIAMVRDCIPDEIGISVSYPLPGTRFYERVKQELSSKQNWVVSQDLEMLFAGTFTPDFYRRLHSFVHKRFSIWRGERSIAEAFRHPLRITPESIRHVAGMIYHGLTLPYERRSLLTLESVRR